MATSFSLATPSINIPIVRTTIDPAIRNLHIMLVRPSSYHDKHGFVRLFQEGTIPSNSLAVMWTLARNALQREEFAHINVVLHTFDDAIWEEHRAMHDLMQRIHARPDTKILVFLVGVQTHELPRARDLAVQWQEACNATACIGGFGVSGVLRTLYWGIVDKRRPDFPGPDRTALPYEIQDLLDRGIIVFDGEAECPLFEQMLFDAVNGNTKQLYYEPTSPDILSAPIPEPPPGYRDHMVGTVMTTVDPTRGCPFICSYCSIINFRGREVRFRDPDLVVQHLIAQAERHGSVHAIFTDDNFARSKRSIELMEKLASARNKGNRITFFTELDVAAIKGKPGYVELLRQAGCTQVFVGIESMNQHNLDDALKLQNNVADYQVFADAMRAAGITVHAGYMIGFPHDTPESVTADVAKLADLFDLASFFCVTPIPGSQDHATAVRNGTPMDNDLNDYNSFKPVWDHPRMSREEWQQAYQTAWETFYTPERMIARINRKTTLQQKLSLLGNYMLWRLAFGVYKVHPMVAGLGQKWDYHDRRPGAVPLPYPAWLPFWMLKRIDRTRKQVSVMQGMTRELLVFKRVILETGLASAVIQERRAEYTDNLHDAVDWMRRTFGIPASRAWLNAFWKQYMQARWRLAWNPLWHARAIPYLCTEFVYWLRATFSPMQFHHPWLDAFWKDYKTQGRRLLNPLNLHRHLAAVPLALTELADTIKFLSIVFPRVMREVKKA